ncbi:hypothetical protein B0H63DRAFT_472392 [Podospora didyma]|uniref:DUF8004 domain-containing protein n=1 Tax=Podospora didyma TaxID=330526 RepID=A0AAE0NPB2_9PEZI|nr:hypothetical protein B0H63DRAFT_472392 [Podospora didyma]
MSGRSAYVRKKITETKPGERGERGSVFRARAKSSASSDNATISEYPISSMPSMRQNQDRDRDRDITGVGTTNARFLKFSEPARESEVMNYRTEMSSYANQSSGSQSGSSVDGRREGTNATHFNRPLEDFAYARARRPAIKTEDVSGIEKSGLRSILDKKSDEVRKGLAKTFMFKKKDKKGHEAERMMDFRPQSSATVRATHSTAAAYSNAYPSPSDVNDGYDADSSPVQYQGPGQGLAAQQWEEAGSVTSGPPSAKLPPVPTTANAPPIKRWIGAGRPVQRWNKLRKDPELWDPNGDVLVFFGTKGQAPRPNPSFRLSSHIVEATESRYLITLLREGSTEEDIHMPPSPVGAPPMLQRHGHAHYGQHQQHLAPHGGGYGRGGQPTPPVSEDANLWESDGQISYEMYFPTPSNMTKLDQVRHHITTRNVFALLYHASLVGLSLYQALSDLHSRLESYMPSEADNIGTILNYLSARGIDDVRNDAETAVSLLAWSEGSEVRWEEGWRESFLHCAGMYSQLEACADFKHVTPITRALLERACLETQLRVQAAEERLAAFQFGDMWPGTVATTANSSGPVGAAPAKAAADRLQKFFLQHYTREFGTWPPLPMPQGNEYHAIGTAHGGTEGEEDMWLTRAVAQSLQKDFAALYDYLVNRDIVWDGSEARSGRKWMMVSESGNRAFEADTPDLPMTDMFIEFDNKLRFPHIPHPYPLVPESIPPPFSASSSSASKESLTSGMFGGRSSSKKNTGTSQGNTYGGQGSTSRPGAVERRIQLAYTEVTNICILGSEFTHSELIDSFSKFEKTDRISEVDPSTARRGRWVLIYGILQTLASVSVDAPNVRYKDEVPYHLSPRLKGAKMPPWKSGPSHGGGQGQANPEEAAHELSHCWIVSRTWNANSSAANSGAESSTEEGGHSPVRGYNFPMPRGPRSTAGRSSVTGYHTPAGMTSRSVRSASSRAPSVVGVYPGFSSAGSVVSYSESDAGSSVRSPPSTTTSRKTGRSAREMGLSVGPGSRQIDRVEEHEWAAPGQTYAYTSPSSDSGCGPDYQRQYHPAPLATSAVGGYSGFLVLDEMMDDQKSFTTAYSGSGRDRAALSAVRGGSNGRKGRGHDRPPHLGRNGGSQSTSREGSVGPVIKDFDELDVNDSHAP